MGYIVQVIVSDYFANGLGYSVDEEFEFNNIDDATDKMNELILEGNKVKLLKEILLTIEVRVDE